MNGQGNRDDEYREMVEIDVQRQHQQQHEQRQQQQQEYFQQDLHSPYGPPERSYTPYSPYQSSVEDMQQGRSITEQGRPSRPSPAHLEDYSPAPEWPPHIANSPGQYFNDTPGGSRSATPSLRSGQETPARLHYHAGNSSVDWRPSSLMVPSPSIRTLVNKSSSVTDQSYRDKQNQSHLSLAALLPNGASTQNTSSNTLVKEHIVDTSAIQHVHKRDDADIWKGWKRWVFRLVPLLTFMNTGFYMAYLALRIACVIWAQNAAGMTYEGAWVFIAVEIAVAIPSLMHNTWTMWSMKKRQRPKLRVTGNDVPTVDAFVTCCGEDDDLVMDTVRAACDLDYPQDRFRVIILDDGKSAGLEEQCAKLSMTYPNLYYMARVKIPGQPHHFKAGNLNYGLDEVHKLPGGAGQFMAALDADMIPERDWLRAIIPHLLIDPKMALACPPQLFYNTPPSDPLAQSLDFFVHVIEPIKDALGVAWCTGSGYVARREALDQIGNFPLGSLAEDVATSTLMLGKGWKTAFIHEPLQFGTVPEDYGGHLKQRTRWAIGTVDTSFKLNFCLWGDKVRQMTTAQRFSGFLYASLSLYTVLLTISMFAIPVILIMQKPLVAYATDEQLRWLIRACFASVISNRICEFALFIPAGYHTGQRGSRYQLWMSPYIALCIIRSFVLPTWLGGQTQAFKPTGSLGSALNERDAKLRKNMFRRLWGILVNYMALFHLFFVYLTLVAVVLTSFRSFITTDTVRDTLTALLTHAFWPPLTFLFICSSLWTPISYAIDPPAMPDREDLLNRDSKTQVAHPTPQSKKIAFGGQAAWFEAEYTVTTIYTCLVFVASFIF
ncbi:nucleotide-diphospho-sugar transferase [Fusarium flagelliforme]|uniref:Cellulose synthase catalytic subunit n=1 Tax=Fusarium flagelliforme TaxID=2675880 RepID=A0A395MXL9_9HYPO|nr:nucleotide-diphospho-sugar transferase [Fusarium flagelliforme]KAH7192607.1 nucleotide-diphospho-sugar transferase [Fusarium flagelliforme]RFN52450.1 cellulose synthase catalytic subunit [Fusarium flagelliforme]